MSRVDDLRAVPARVRFLSCEPLLGPLSGLDLSGIGWVIAGGESAPATARPPAWVAGIRICARPGCAVLLDAVRRADPESRGTRAGGACVGRAPAADWHQRSLTVFSSVIRPGGLTATSPRSRIPDRLGSTGRGHRASRSAASCSAPSRELPGLKTLGRATHRGMPSLTTRSYGAGSPAAGTGIAEAHSVVAVNVPHSLFHHLHALLVPGPEDQVQRLASAGNDLELQPLTEARSPQRVGVLSQPCPPPFSSGASRSAGSQLARPPRPGPDGLAPSARGD